MNHVLDQFGAIRAVIKIQTPPVYNADIGEIIPGQLIGFDTSERGGPADDLLSVATQKQMDQAAGRFQLVFVPRVVWRGLTWIDLIPPYSLCEIYLQRYPQDEQPVLVMVGLTDAQIEGDDYSDAMPQRTRQLTGYELSGLLADQRILYLPVPPDQRQVLLAPDVFAAPADPAGRTSTLQNRDADGRPVEGRVLPPTASPELAAFASKDGGEKAMLAVDPVLSSQGDSPIAVIDRVVRMLTVGLETPYNKNGLPLLNFDFPDARLRDLLFFDRTRATLFDTHARLPASAQISADTNLWNLLTTFSDDVFQELFARSVDPSQILPEPPAELNADGSVKAPKEAAGGALASRSLNPAVEIVFRKRPFAGRINESGEVVGVADARGSQFDRSFAATETVEIDDAISWNLMRNGRDVYNTYLVYPRVPNFNSPEEPRAMIAPVVDAGRLSPSSGRRFGPRLLEVQDVYLPANLQGDLPFVTLAHSRELLLWAWYRFNPSFRQGEYVLRGNATLQAGKRLVHTSRTFKREYYVVGVGHSMTFGRDPRFVTTATVERGWPLQG